MWMATTDDRGVVKYWQSNMNNVHSFQAHNETIRGCRWETQESVPGMLSIRSSQIVERLLSHVMLYISVFVVCAVVCMCLSVSYDYFLS